MRLRGDSRNGIPPEIRRETDCRDYDGVLTMRTPFYPSEYSESTLRLRHFEKLPKDLSKALLRHFQAYQTRWNELVALDRSGIRVRAVSGDRTARDYVRRRRLASHPLRTKSWSRVHSIPVTADIRRELRPHLYLDWRKVQGLRLLRFGRKVVLSYTLKETRIREVDLEERTIKSCRDPRLCDLGISFSDKGMAFSLQTPTDNHISDFTPKHLLTKQSLLEFTREMVGKIRVVALDPVCPASMRDLKSYLTRKLRALQAEGTIEFRTPRWISLGDKYDLPARHPDRPPAAIRKLMRENYPYCQILGLTGSPLLVKEVEGGLVGADGRQIDPLTRANHVIQSVMAKLDLWHGATFLRSVNSQSVHKAFRRYQCELQREGVREEQRPRLRSVDRIPSRGSSYKDSPPSPAKRGSATA